MAPTKKPTTKTKTKPATERPVLVTTANRGVFFGYTTTDGAPESIRILRARMVVYWAPECRSILGLCDVGPIGRSKVSKPAPGLDVRNVTSVADVSAQAVAVFEAAPWA